MCAVLALAVLASACSGVTSPTTASGEGGVGVALPSSSTVPVITDELILRLQIRAIQRAWPGWDDSSSEPVCLFDDQSPEYVAAIREVFPKGGMPIHSPQLSFPPLDCAFVVPDGSLERLSASVVGVGVWAGNTKHTWWFRWDMRVTGYVYLVTDKYPPFSGRE